jgi:hypothetical protein
MVALYVPNHREYAMPQFSPTNTPLSATTRVQSAIASAAQKTGVDFGYLLNQARIESSLNPDAKAATSSATGLFQFTNQTWLATVKAHGGDHDLGWAADAITRNPGGAFTVSNPAMRSAILDLRTQPEAASSMAAEFASDNATFLGEQLGHDPEPVDLYLAHFLGAAGASEFLQGYAANPEGSAALVLPKAAAANHAIFYRGDGSMRSFAEIRGRFAAKLGDPTQAAIAATQRRSASVAQFSSSETSLEYTALRPFVAMPQHLSLDFARNSYERLAAMGGGSR